MSEKTTAEQQSERLGNGGIALSATGKQGTKRKLDQKPLEIKYSAITEFEKGKKSKTEIAKMFDVPKNTLSGWIKNADSIKEGFAKYGPKRRIMRQGVKKCSTMGEMYQYHITMLVTSEQEDAIRTVFRDKNWPCWLKVLSDETVAVIIQNGFTDIFPVMTEGQDGGIGRSVFTEIKSEIVDIDIESTPLDEVNDSHRKVEPPDMSENEDTMDYDMMVVESKEESSTANNTSPDSKKNISNNELGKGSPKDENGQKVSSRFKCTLCEVSCVTRTILKRHFKRRHKGTWLDFECSDCQKRFKTKEDLWEHRRKADHEPSKDFGKPSNMFQHTPEELQNMGHLKCEICSNYYPHKRSLRRHLYKVHRDILPKWNCPICGAEFETRDELWKHKREKQHKTNIWTLGNYQCDSCGRIYNRYDSFTEHKISCQKTEGEKLAIRQYPCDICGLVFKSMIRVKSHKRGVHVVAPVVCHECGAMCKNKRALLVHRRRHDMKNKKYVCDDCGKSFFNSTLLSQHVRTHTKEKPFKCPLCNYTCAIKQNIHKHSQKVHKVQCKAVCVSDTKERVLPQNDDLLHSGQNFGIANILNKEVEALKDLQSQSIELHDQHSRSSFKSENTPAMTRPHSDDVLDFSRNYDSQKESSFQYQL